MIVGVFYFPFKISERQSSIKNVSLPNCKINVFCKLRFAGGEDADRGGRGVRRSVAALPWNAGLQLVRHDV